MIKHPNLAITRDPEVQGGTPVFAGTRVPVDVLLDYVEDDAYLTAEHYYEHIGWTRTDAWSRPRSPWSREELFG